MANAKIIEEKKQLVSEIVENFKNSTSVVFFDYRGLTVSETTELRRKLKNANCSFKIYKNTMVKRAADELKYSLDEYLTGPNAITFSPDALEPVKILSEFAKKHNNLELKVGIIDGELSKRDVLDKLATIPSRDTLLTMLAAGLIGKVKDLAICLDLYGKQIEEKN
ncbi:MAG: 50S ribosomal protein L10 [bacterium]|nr:50S ribosomal protein L10 [bacterium]